MLKVKDKYDYRRELCEALRSGKYKQGRGSMAFLPEAKHPCVLGVARRLMGDLPVELRYEYETIGQKLGINAGDLWMRNDGALGIPKHTFAEIADYIESLP